MAHHSAPPPAGAALARHCAAGAVAAENGVEDVDIYGSGDGAKSHGLIQDAQQALELWASYRR